jgi:hypothetical protein
MREIEIHARESFRNEMPEVVVWHLEHPTWKARLATTLVEKWGLVAATEDGEDSAGRAKLRLSTPVELVKRACETADMLVEECRSRGWIEKLPTREEAKQLVTPEAK